MNENPDKSDHGHAAAPRHAFAERLPVCRTHDLVDGDARPLASQRSVLRGDITAHTRTGLRVLDEAERDDGGEDDQTGEASHPLIIDSVEHQPRRGEDCEDDNDQDDRPSRPAAMLEDRPFGRRLDLGVGGRSSAAITDERVVGNFGVAVPAFHPELVL